MTRQINAGGVLIGGDAPVTVQSMCDTDTRDVRATLAQIRLLAEAGCDIVRVAVPDGDAAEALCAIVKESPVPVVADIHFDHKLAVRSVQNGAAKVRVNPGNIGSREKVREVVRACKEHRVPIRIGVNGGSVKQELRESCGLVESMLLSALEQVQTLEDMGFNDICLSFKASNAADTVTANRMAAGVFPDCDKWKGLACYPLHLGVTETGTPYGGLIKSAAGIGSLLLDGIGGTIRVSLTDSPAEEVRAGLTLLRVLGLRRDRVEIISCPQCARRGIDVAAIAGDVEQKLSHLRVPLKIAVMGCSVNGPGEAREADLGVAGGGGGQAALFRRGEVVRKIAQNGAAEILVSEALALAKELYD